MRKLYANEAAMQADAKAEKAKVVLDTPPPPLPGGDDGHYAKGPGGLVHRQFTMLDEGLVVYNGFLIHTDPVAAMGAAGTVKMPVTAHVLSIPRNDVGESLVGYYIRTSRQTGANPERGGEFAERTKLSPEGAPTVIPKVPKDKAAKAATTPPGGTTPSPTPPIPPVGEGPFLTGDPAIDWPLCADWYANPGAYELPPNVLPEGAGVTTPPGTITPPNWTSTPTPPPATPVYATRPATPEEIAAATPPAPTPPLPGTPPPTTAPAARA